MAQQGVLLDQDQFCCSVCLDLLKEPVTIPCGHSYCMGCIKDCWDREDQKGVYSCPRCRQNFTPRPVLMKNNMLAEVMEKLKKTGLQATPPADSYAGPGDVVCDVCTGRKQKALQSCLVCLASYCETHLQPHYESPAFKKHKLGEASSQLQENICSRHDEVMKIFCRTDQQSICYLCSMYEHKGHDTVTVVAERTDKQRELVLSQQKVKRRVQKIEKKMKELQQAKNALIRSAKAAEENCDKVFTELMHSIERRLSEVKKQIRAQQGAAVSQADGLLEGLEQETAELKKRDAELEQLSHTEDHIQFLHSYQSLSSSSVSSELPSIVVPPVQYFGEWTEAVSKLREKLEDLLKGEWSKITTTVNLVEILMPPEPKTRAGFLQCSCQLTLDSNTAHETLSLCENNRKVKMKNQHQRYPHHPDRFTDRSQVLCREGLSGRWYWEVEWRGWICAGVSYKDISRTGSGMDSGFGCNIKSWMLACSSGGYVFIHNKVKTIVSGPQSSRVGVYLDHRAGTLSFYSISDTMTLLHRVQTTFTQPLYPGFGIGWSSSAELCQLK